MTISLLNVARYFTNLPHQVEALEFLQNNVPPDTLQKFADKWRKAKLKPIEQKIGERLSALDIKLDKGINILALEGCDFDFSANSDEFWTDTYNDLWLTVWADEPGQDFKILGKYVCTTEPGVYWTTSTRRNRQGAARLQIDYKQQNLWMIGQHKNQYPALVQIGNKVKVVRDFNKDGFRTGDTVYEGWFGERFAEVAA